MPNGTAALAMHSGVRYLDTGGLGPPIVLLHGLGNSLSFWTPLVERLRERRLIALDLPGYGQSLRPSGADADALTGPLHALLESLEATPCVVVGHSLGGLVALHYAKEVPAAVSSIVLLDAHLFSASDLLTQQRSPFRDPLLVLVLAAQFIGGLVPMRGPLPYLITSTSIARRVFLWPFVYAPRYVNGAILRHALAGNIGGCGVLNAYRLGKTYDIRASARAVRCPVDLVWGAHDRLLRQRDHEEAGIHLNLRRQLEIANAGHWPQLERPERLASFLRDVS